MMKLTKHFQQAHQKLVVWLQQIVQIMCIIFMMDKVAYQISVVYPERMQKLHSSGLGKKITICWHCCQKLEAQSLC